MSTNQSAVHDSILTWLVLAWFFTPIGVVGWQVYGYLRFGFWQSISVIDALRWTGNQWAVAPTDWVGLYGVLELLPLSAGVAFFGGLVFLVAKAQD